MRRLDDSGAHRLAHGEWPRAVRRMRTDLDGGVRSGRIARGCIAAEFATLLSEQELQTAQLLVTELVNNAVAHAGAGGRRHLTLHFAVAPERVRAEVRDGGPGLDPRNLPPRTDPMGGRGLAIVDACSSRWGAASDGVSCVWFELDR